MRPALVGMVSAILTNCCNSLYSVWHFSLFNTENGSSSIGSAILGCFRRVSGLLGRGGNSSKLTTGAAFAWASWSGVEVIARRLHLFSGGVFSFGFEG
ncbi:hypothetical protein NPIL_266731 [Nephila pilipes]|uniref:Uncharacterized protein n=1 Tax=Nephila pilipes TaxID=299642 RepID=A0A8X6UCF0_NEPPI|nr:hypothetical protein NPIL_266731 [Nephila pilipes]